MCHIVLWTLYSYIHSEDHVVAVFCEPDIKNYNQFFLYSPVIWSNTYSQIKTMKLLGYDVLVSMVFCRVLMIALSPVIFLVYFIVSSSTG